MSKRLPAVPQRQDVQQQTESQHAEEQADAERYVARTDAAIERSRAQEQQAIARRRRAEGDGKEQGATARDWYCRAAGLGGLDMSRTSAAERALDREIEMITRALAEHGLTE